jgi:hypothetical protein
VSTFSHGEAAALGSGHRQDLPPVRTFSHGEVAAVGRAVVGTLGREHLFSPELKKDNS